MSTIDHYGKRGIGWHGCALTYYRYENLIGNDGEPETDVNGNEMKSAVKYIIYIDQIMEETN